MTHGMVGSGLSLLLVCEAQLLPSPGRRIPRRVNGAGAIACNRLATSMSAKALAQEAAAVEVSVTDCHEAVGPVRTVSALFSSGLRGTETCDILCFLPCGPVFMARILGWTNLHSVPLHDLSQDFWINSSSDCVRCITCFSNSTDFPSMIVRQVQGAGSIIC